jgi:hypothetical protein
MPWPRGFRVRKLNFMSSRATRKLIRKIERLISIAPRDRSVEVLRTMEMRHPAAFARTKYGKAWKIAKKLKGEENWTEYTPSWVAPQTGIYHVTGGETKFIRKGDTLEISGRFVTAGVSDPILVK